ncbi:MAG: hypothetical protein PHG82_00815 [Candidatus Gracilibacteria bacterium]|nr:hypothetical protein [Candidatus Gracilibacteria bacterium]
MKNFKVELSKDSKKYTFVLKANYEIELKEKFHKEGYNILSISEIDNIEVSGQAFYFEIFVNSELKKGTINSSDIFKAYLKLRKELGYRVRYIYDKLDATEEEKIELVNKLEKQFDLFNINNVSLKKEEIITKKEENKNDDNKQENFYLKKELDESYNVIGFVLIKLKNIIDGKIDENISIEQKQKLTDVYNNLIKVKTSTNISKLKEVGEVALKRIGEIELRALESKKTKEFEQVLQETNKLLKKVGSKTQFIEKEKDLGYILENLGNNIKEFFINNFKSEKVQKQELDKESYYYLKNETLLKRYLKLKQELDKEKLQNIGKFIFAFSPENKDFVIKYNIKQALINQNIDLLKAKLNNKSFSYTKIVNTYEKGLGKILNIFNILKNSIFYFIFLYSIFFIFFISFTYYLNLDYSLNLATLKYIILLLLFYFYFTFSKNFTLILLNSIFFGFSIVIYLINF